MKYKNIKKRYLLASGMTALMVGAGVYIGNYFVDYALVRPIDNAPDPRSPTYEAPTGEPKTPSAEDLKVDAWKNTNPPTEVILTTEDGLNLWTNRYDVSGSNLWLIAVHGYQSEHSSVEDYACEYFKRGYNVLTPDLRAHGNSDGDYIGMGLNDSQDILMWVDYIVTENPNAEIVLHGQSMGAATVMIAAGDPELPKNVVAVIEDSGYTDGYEMMKEQLNYRFNLPPFPVLDLATIMAVVRADYNLHDVNPLSSLEKATVPILFIHGTADNFVLPYMHTELYNAYQGEKASLIIEDAGHVDSRLVNPELFYQTVFDFLDNF